MKSSEKYRKIKMKFAVHSLLVVLLLLLLVTFLTLIGYQSGMQMDMTEQKIFTLTEETVSQLESLTEPVRIAAVYPEGREEAVVKALLTEYENGSEQISVSYVDAEKHPEALADYRLGDVAAIYNGSLIVESSKRTRIIRNEQLFDYTSSGNYFYGEREITGALKYVSAETLSNVYFVTGHGEINTGTSLQNAVSDLARNAYQTKSIVLLQEDIPEDADILVIVSPKEDFVPEELDKLEKFTDRGGSLFLMVDPVMTGNQDSLGKLNKFVNGYGIDISNNYVVEENSSYYLTDNNMYLIPRYSSHEITAPIGNEEKIVVLLQARGLGMTEGNESGVNTEVLLQSSDKAWARNDMENTSANRTSLDIEGPIALGLAAQRSNVKKGNLSSRVVALGDSNYITDGNYGMQANAKLFMNCINWLSGEKDSGSVAGKVMNAERLLVSGNDFMKLAVICCLVLPAIAFFGALWLWRIRRNG